MVRTVKRIDTALQCAEYVLVVILQKIAEGVPAGSVVKILLPTQATWVKIPQAWEQVSLCATTTEPAL